MYDSCSPPSLNNPPSATSLMPQYYIQILRSDLLTFPYELEKNY